MTEQEMDELETRMNAPPPKKTEDESKSAREVLAHLALAKVLPSALRERLLAGKSAAVVMTVPSTQWLEPIAEALRTLRNGGGTFRIVSRGKILKDRDEPGLCDRLAAGGSAIGISPAPNTMLPQVLISVADFRLVMPQLSAELVLSVIRRLQHGRIPRSAKAIDFSQLDFDELTSAIVADRTPRETIQRLEDMIKAKNRVGHRRGNLPRLEEAYEYGEAREWALNLRDDIQDWKNGHIPADAVDRGILLTGAPGVGKTLYARMLGEACGIQTVVASMGEFFASTAGHLDSVIKAQRAAFDEAKRQAPCILFLDEIDALPNPATLSHRGRDWWMPVILDFYQLLDGALDDRDGVIVIGATNAPVSELAPALLRPGRLERAVHIGPPNAEGAIRIIRHHLAGELAAVDLDRLGVMCEARQATGAVIMEMVRAARRRARRAGRSMIMEDLEIQLVPKDDRSDSERWRAAIHESGHALLASLLDRGMVHSASIVADANSGGETNLLGKAKSTTRADKYGLVKILLGGRAAEVVTFGEASEGAGGSEGSDLAQATALVTAGFLSTGIEDTLLYRAPPQQVREVLALDPELRRRVGQVLAMLHEQAKVILSEHRPALEGLAGVLLERQFLNSSEIAEALERFGMARNPSSDRLTSISHRGLGPDLGD